jgi:hypothetical protein
MQGRQATRTQRGERLLYALIAGGLTLAVACRFYASMRLQTTYTGQLPLARPGEWSAPLDDVFIHFDFARSIARGHPFEWSEGNGYSSGGTSLLYPFVLAPGFLIGFRGSHLMLWAAVLACVSTFALLLGSRRLFRDLPAWTSYLAPPALLGVGVLCWTLFSGMEVAFLLAIWASALIAWDDLVRGPPGAEPPARPLWPALLVGGWGAALTATRPEAITTVAVLSAGAGLLVWRRLGLRAGSISLLASGAPAVLVLVGHALANRMLTGEATAAGALVKLELHHPHMSSADVWNAWLFHLRYQVVRLTHHHLSDTPVFGWIPWLLAALALVFRSTRRHALLLWASAASWLFVVSLNGQVRWQNERYSMPALAWLLLAAALGTGALLSWGWQRRRRLLPRIAATAAGLAAIGLFAEHQRPRYRDQLWFFGRASRNIRDQHVVTGRLIRHALEPRPRRVLVGDAGAIPFAADVPALDIIGLGGFRNLPFARATRLGLGAAIELIERTPPAERPDLLAIYPGWWGDLPLWFGHVIGEVPVRGNVICGGLSKVLYRPDWRVLDSSRRPAELADNERVVDELDVGDLVSEREHDYRISNRTSHIEMRLLPDPARPAQDLWDAGRILPAGVSETFRLAPTRPGRSARLVFRLAPVRAGTIDVWIDDRLAGSVSYAAIDGWLEPVLEIPPSPRAEPSRVRLVSTTGERVMYHVWLIEAE